MSFHVVGCNHRNTSIALRERLAFSAEQVCRALEAFQTAFPAVEAVLLSTCNRVEIYAAAESDGPLSAEAIGDFVAHFHQLDPAELRPYWYHHRDEEAMRHLLAVACSLDSMVVGEAQILAQVKTAYQTAVEQQSAGPWLHAAFQAALKTARRVAAETALGQRRVSVPSVAVADFARQIFERFDDKHTLVIGAGEMAEETLRYLQAEGARQITVVNRSWPRAEELAGRWGGRARPWEQLPEALVQADLVISTTGASQPVVGLQQYLSLEPARYQKPLFVLDLAVPRDFDPAIGDRPGVYLYSIDDLQSACVRNQHQRDKSLPAARRIVEQEAAFFFSEMRRRASAPVIQRLHEGWQKPKEEELRRLWNKLPDLDDHAREEIRQAFDRLLNKLLHPPMESLRDESRQGIPHALLDALTRLFQLKD